MSEITNGYFNTLLMELPPPQWLPFVSTVIGGKDTRENFRYQSNSREEPPIERFRNFVICKRMLVGPGPENVRSKLFKLASTHAAFNSPA
jgi:hypothetical protein